MEQGSWMASGAAGTYAPARGLASEQPATDLVERTVCVVMCLLAASLPNDSVLGGYDPETGIGLRSPSYYLGMLGVGLSVLLLPRLLQVFMRCRALQLLVGATTTALVILLVMVLAGEARLRAEYAIDRPYKSMLMALLFIYCASRPIWRRRLILSYLGGWIVFVVAALYLVLIGDAPVTLQFGAPRQAVMGMNPNVQATIAASGMVLLLMEAIYHRNLWQLLVGIVGFVLGGIVFLAGSSRTGLAGLAAALLVAVFSTTRLAKRDRRSILLRTIAVGVVLVGAILWLRSHDESFFEAFDSMTTRTGLALSGDDTGDRKEAMLATLGVAMAHPGGVGLGRTLDYIGMDPHNGYVKIVAEGGVLGLVFLVAYILVVARDTINAARRVEDQGAVAAFVLFSVAAASGQALVESPYWFFFSFVAFAPPPAAPRRARPA